MPESRLSQQGEIRRRVRESLVGHVAIACSGGVDSTALAILAGQEARSGAEEPPVIVHVDHMAREGSASEADHVALLARSLDLPFVRTRVRSCGAFAKIPREHELRSQRYDALGRVVALLGLNAVVTAHTLDDQVETILMRLFSGVGSSSAAGMRTTTTLMTSSGDIQVRRPFLAVRRSTLHDITLSLGFDYLEDPSNVDRRYRRNALRHDVIPRITNLYPGFEVALQRSVGLAAQDGDYIDGVAATLAQTAITRDGSDCSIDRRVVKSSHPAIATRLIRLALTDLIGEHARELTVERVDSVVSAAFGRTGARIELPGRITANIERDAIVFKQGRDEV